MAWAATSKVVWGSLCFVVWWMLSVFRALPLLPIGRTAGSLMGGTLMVVTGVLSPDEAFAAVDLPILGLLFGTMVVSVMLQKVGLFTYLGILLTWKTRGGMDLLCRLSILAALSSALFTNDTTCVFLTGFVLKLCKDKKLHPKPFLLALACSANIGSAATPIGNPQNLVIAVGSGISFGRFLKGMLPATAIGLLVNTLLLVVVYGRHLSLRSTIAVELMTTETGRGEGASDQLSHQTGQGGPRDPVDDISEGNGEIVDERLELEVQEDPQHDSELGDRHETVKPGFGVAIRSRLKKSFAPIRGRVLRVKLRLRAPWRRHKDRVWKAIVYLVTAGMLSAFLAGLSLPWTAITAAVAMLVLNFSDAGPSLDKVSYNLLVFFSGMFIATSGFNATGAPQEFWSAMEPHSHIDTASGISVLSLVVTVLSNVVSNVPTVILLGGRVAASAVEAGASSDKAWLILAWVSTVAGNLTLVGSAANIIVCEEARETEAEKKLREEQQQLHSDSNVSPEPARAFYNLSFWNHLKFGFPSTLIVITVGLIPIAFEQS